MNSLIRMTLLALLGLVAAGTVAAQQPSQQPPQQPPPQEQPATPGTPATPPVNQEEENDFKAFYAVAREEAQQQVQLGEAFLTKYPDSRYRGAVYSRLVTSYLALGDVDKLFITGEKALEIDPDNVDVLSIIAYSVPRRIDVSDLDGQRRLQKVEEYSRRCLEVLNGMIKPEGLTEEEFARAKNEKLAMTHSGLGLVNFYKSDFAGMASELEQATQLSLSPDPSDFYLLAIAYTNVSRFSDAAAAYGKCAVVSWAFQDRCKQGREEALKKAGLQPAP